MQTSFLHPLFQRLSLKVPVFPSPIGSIASPELAAAVSDAGGLGHLVCTWRSPEQLAELFRAMRNLTAKPYGANFVLDFPIEERLAVALEHRVPVISFFWGDGSPYVERVKRAGAVAVQVVGSIGEAKRAAEAGFDLFVAQGRDAGGHVRGEAGLMALLPQVVDAVAPVPVLAAGGIADRRGVIAGLSLGAVGVWVGTSFLAPAEANIHAVYRDRVLASSGDDTLYSKLFDISWPKAPLRTLRTPLTQAWERAGRPPSPGRPGEGGIVARRGERNTPLSFWLADARGDRRHRSDGTLCRRSCWSRPLDGARCVDRSHARRRAGSQKAWSPTARIPKPAKNVE